MKTQECVKVTMRCRPLNKQEMADNRQVVLKISPTRGEILVKNPNEENQDKQFTFDNVFDWTSTQDNVYQDTAYPIVQSVIEGYNGTIFAYGQTGTGKTFTMEGLKNYKELFLEHLIIFLTRSEELPKNNFQYVQVFLNYITKKFVIFLQKIIKINQNQEKLPNKGSILKILATILQMMLPNQGISFQQVIKQNRGQIQIYRRDKNEQRIIKITFDFFNNYRRFYDQARWRPTHNSGKIESRRFSGYFNNIGSERQSKTGAVGDRFKEAISINQSLSSLGNVISALVDGKSQHIPYRDSKLTRLLQDSLGGNTKTVMIANIGPADYNYDETLSTLRYASRAKNIKNKPKINEDPKDAMIRQFQDEITLLKIELAKKLGGVDPTTGELIPQEVQEIEQIQIVEDEEKMRQFEEKLHLEKQQFAAQMDQERIKIEKQKNLAVEDKKKLLQLIDEKEQKQLDIQENKKNLVNKLKNMEEQLLQGSKLKQQAVAQERELQKARMQIEEKKQKERRLKEELDRKKADQMDVEQKYKDIKEEIDTKTEKMNTLIQKIQESVKQKQEIQGKLKQSEYRLREKDILMEENRNLTREIKLLDLIVENFIAHDEVAALNQKLKYDESQDEWYITDEIINKINKPESSLGLRYSMSEFSRMAVSFGDQNPRYKYDNILQLDLDLPEQTTEEFDGQVSQKLQETIHISLNENDEENLQISGEMKPNVYIDQVPQQKPVEKKKRPQSGIKK